MFTLREYQEKSVQDCIDFINRNPVGRAGLCVLPTAGGKSLIISELAHRLNTNILCIAPSKELIRQNYAKYLHYSNDAAIYSASLNSKQIGTVTFGTIGSVISAVDKFKAIGLKILVVDEAHIGSKKGKKNENNGQIYEFCKKVGIKWVIGLTATPIVLKQSMSGGAELRMMNRARDSFFQEIIHVTQISELTSKGYWSKVNYMPVTNIKEGSLRYNSSGTDFTEESLRKFNEINEINEKIVHALKELRGRGRKKTLIFMSSVADSFGLKEKIPNSEVVYGNMDDKYRDHVINEFVNGKLDVVINVNVLGTGFDFPKLDSAIHARPTNSASLWYQHIGRLVRIHPDKKDADLIDLSGNFKRFGKVEDFTFERDQVHGWAMFSGNRKLTNVDLKYGRHEYKSEKSIEIFAHSEYSSYIWTFGKHKGIPIGLIPKSYLEWVSGDEFIPTYQSAIEAKEIAIKFLNK